MDGESKVRQINRVARYLEVRDARLAEAEVFKETDRQAQKWLDRFDMFAAAALQALVGSQEFADRCNANPEHLELAYANYDNPEDAADVWVAARAKAIALEMVLSSEDIYINAYDDVALDYMMKEKRNVQQES